MTITLEQAQQAVDLSKALDTLNLAQTVLAAAQTDGVPAVPLTIIAGGYKGFAGFSVTATVPLSVVQQVLAAELATVQAQFNALGVSP